MRRPRVCWRPLRPPRAASGPQSCASCRPVHRAPLRHFQAPSLFLSSPLPNPYYDTLRMFFKPSARPHTATPHFASHCHQLHVELTLQFLRRHGRRFLAIMMYSLELILIKFCLVPLGRSEPRAHNGFLLLLCGGTGRGGRAGTANRNAQRAVGGRGRGAAIATDLGRTSRECSRRRPRSNLKTGDPVET